MTALPVETEKFITINGGTKELYPCDSKEKNIYYVKSGTQKNFYHDITESAPMMMNEGYTVTFYSLQALYYLGCQTVYIIGMDHSFQQSGGPNQKQLMKGEDPNVSDRVGIATSIIRSPFLTCCDDLNSTSIHPTSRATRSVFMRLLDFNSSVCLHACVLACLRSPVDRLLTDACMDGVIPFFTIDVTVAHGGSAVSI